MFGLITHKPENMARWMYHTLSDQKLTGLLTMNHTTIHYTTMQYTVNSIYYIVYSIVSALNGSLIYNSRGCTIIFWYFASFINH